LITSITQRHGEHHAVLGIMEKALASSSNKILSAFVRDSIPCRIYVEAPSEEDVNRGLRGVDGVYLHVRPTLVTLEDRVGLLRLRDLDDPVVEGSWVRPKRGKYRRDLGVVLSVDNCLFDIALVPRIRMINPDTSTKGKRKQRSRVRPPQQLFNAEAITQLYGPTAVVARNRVQVFKGDIYKNGLVELSFDLTNLRTQNVEPQDDELRKFHGIDDERILAAIAGLALSKATANFSVGDKVEIVSGEQKGLKGVVDSVMVDLVRFAWRSTNEQENVVDISPQNIRKYFVQGDYVTVGTGIQKGRSGWVVESTTDAVTFCEVSSLEHVRPNV
jgi:transcription elongation factor SPT5